MADPNDILLNLKTTGDTSGAEAVEKSLFAAEDAAKQASRQADVDLVKGKQAAEVQREQAETLAQIAQGQERIVAANLADALGKVSNQFRGMSPEVDLAIDASKNFLNTLASTGNPVTASLALIGTAIGGVVTAYQEAAKTTKEIAKEEQENLKKIKELRADWAQDVRTQGLVDFFKKENDQLNEQEAALNRIVRINASERELAAKQQAASGAAAVAASGSPEAAAAANIQTAATNQANGLFDQLAQVRQAVTNAEKLASDTALAAQALNQSGNNAKEAIDTTKAAVEAEKALKELKADLPTREIEIINQIKGGQLDFITQVKAQGTAGQQAVTEAVTAERDALAAEVAARGSQASSGAKAALEILNKILEKDGVTAAELAQLGQAQAQLRGTQEQANTLVKEGFETTDKALKAVIEKINPVISSMKDSLRRIESLEINAGLR